MKNNVTGCVCSMHGGRKKRMYVYILIRKSQNKSLGISGRGPTYHDIKMHATILRLFKDAVPTVEL
jgi:hypothetical protein